MKRNKMEFFKIISPVGKTSKQHLDSYQADKALGYKINCMDGSFEIHEWCLYNSDILLTLLKGPSQLEIEIEIHFLTNNEK